MNAKGEKIMLTLTLSDGSVFAKVKIDAKLWADFEKDAQKHGVSVEELFEAAVDAYFESKGIGRRSR